MNDIIKKYASIFRNNYYVLYKGTALDNIEDIHELNSLNGVELSNYY